MPINNFYSGDLTPITVGEIGAQNADTAASDSLRRYLVGLAMSRNDRDRNNVDRERTATNRDISFNDADVRRQLGLGGLDVDRSRIATSLKMAQDRNALDRELGVGGLDVERNRIATAIQLAKDRNALDRELGLRSYSVTERGQDVSKALGLAGIDAQKYGIDATRDVEMDRILSGDYRAGLTYDLGLKSDATARAALQNRLDEIEAQNKGVIQQIEASGKYQQMNPRVTEMLYGLNSENANADAAANAVAARANMMIPGVADEIGSMMPWNFGESALLKSLTPGGNPSARSKLLGAVLKNLGADASMVIPTETGFKPVLRGQAVTAPIGASAIDRDRAGAKKAIERAMLYPPDQANAVINNINAEFFKKWRENP